MEEGLAKFCARHCDIYVFKPFAVEVHGRMGVHAVQVAKEICELSRRKLADEALDVSVSLYEAFYIGLGVIVA